MNPPQKRREKQSERREEEERQKRMRYLIICRLYKKFEVLSRLRITAINS